MLTVLIDYDSGNLHSAAKAFERTAAETGGGDILVTRDPEQLLRADRVVLPGDGAFPHCRAQLFQKTGLFEALEEVVIRQARPFLGICVGMQLMASWGREYEDTPGFDWISGEVVPIKPKDPALKVPHMGWNDLVLDMPDHPVLAGLESGDHAYFVHSYHFEVAAPELRLAHCDYGGAITAVIGRDHMVGTQFHPEKSQASGLRLIANFLGWKP
ncbi:MAG: imidazole glycerol phosphate synthase subunit HisH [Pseudomonadota bacterium]